MNHTNKRPLFIIILVIVLALILAACGGGEEASPSAAAPPTEPAAPPAEATTAPEAAPDVRPDIPLLADAANLTVAEAGGEYSVSYSSASGLEAAASFYQAQMPPQGWAYDANVSSAAGGVNTVLAFQKGEETAAITLAKVGDGVQIIIAVAPRQMEETAGAAGEAAAETAAEPPPTAPPAEPAAPPAEPTGAPEVAAGPDGMGMAGDIPIMEGATGVVTAREGADYVVTYQSSAGVDDVVAFYQTEMPLRDWAYDGGASSLLPGVSAELHFTRADGEAGVSITTLGLSTQVAVAISGQAADAAEAAGSGSAGGGGDAAPQPTTAAAQPPPAGSAPGGRADIPLMDDAVSVEVTTAGGDFTTTYNSASSVDVIKSFYESQMPAYGWTYTSGDTAYVPGVSGTLYYTKNGEDLTVSINIQGDVTRVQIVIN